MRLCDTANLVCTPYDDATKTHVRNLGNKKDSGNMRSAYSELRDDDGVVSKARRVLSVELLRRLCNYFVGHNLDDNHSVRDDRALFRLCRPTSSDVL